MTKTSKIWIVVIVILAIVAGFALWAYKANRQSKVIKIGAVLSLSGDAAQNGEAEQKGIQLAVEEINASGGIGGKKLEIIFEDDNTDAKSTVSAVTKLTSVDHVPAIIGATWDFLTNAIVPIIDQNKTVLVTPSTLPDTITASSSYLFETHAPIAVLEPAMETFLSQFVNPRVVIMTINNPWGLAYVRAFEKAAAAKGATIVKEVILPKFDDNDIQGQLTLLKPLHPDAMLTALNFDDSVTFFKRREAFGLAVPTLAEEKTEGLYAIGDISANLLGNVFMDRFSFPNAAFVNAYRARYGSGPQEYADTAYDAVYAIRQGILNADGQYTSSAIQAGLKKISGYHGASGIIDFTKNNYPQNETPVIDELINGKFQAVD